MKRVMCCKLQEELDGLSAPPSPGDLGSKIFEQVSEKAWKMWIEHQTMLINEYRLSLLDPKAKEFLRTEMDAFFFGKGSAKPQGYLTPDQSQG